VYRTEDPQCLELRGTRQKTTERGLKETPYYHKDLRRKSEVEVGQSRSVARLTRYFIGSWKEQHKKEIPKRKLIQKYYITKET